MKYLFLFLSVVFALPVFAQAAAAPTWGDAILAWMHSAGAGTIVTGVVTVVVFLVRMFPTAQAWCPALTPVKYALVSVAAMLEWVANTLVQPLIDNLNNVTAPPATPQVQAKK